MTLPTTALRGNGASIRESRDSRTLDTAGRLAACPTFLTSTSPLLDNDAASSGGATRLR